MEVGGFTFVSDFDSGNLRRVELVAQKELFDGDADTEKAALNDEDSPDYEFNLWTKPDCVGTEYENGNRTWFYFGIKGGTPFALIQLNIVDLNKQTKMYSQGMAPVYRIVPGRNHWERIKDKPHFHVKDNVFTLTFRYRTLENTKATTYFAFTYPFPYLELQNMLQAIDSRFRHLEDIRKHVDPDDIYYHRECVCYSLEGRRVELITVTSFCNITKEREPRLKYLFPDTRQPRPFHFAHKKVVFCSARVHPGETPSSFVLNGFLNFVLKRDDPVAVMLRKTYVFKFIPMLNPDGVCRGHYRTDTRGVNLNRVYLSPSFALHPSIYAARSLILYYHHGFEVEEVVTGPVFDPAARRYKLRQTTMSPSESLDSAVLSSLLSPTATASSYTAKSSVSAMLAPTTHICSSTHTVGTAAPTPVCRTAARYVNPQVDLDSGIENQVSGLSLNEKCDQMALLRDPSKDSVSKESDMLAVICESFIKRVFDVSEVESRTTVSVVGGGLQNRPLLIETRPHGSKSCPAVESVPPIKLSGLGHSECPLSQRSDTSLSVGDGSIRSSCSSGVYTRKSLRDHERLRMGDGKSCNKMMTDPVPDDGKKLPYTSPENSGLFLYVDLHGHASKKGIFMYGNHFDNAVDSVECMLLPKVMSLNSPNFHFSACNFTERNMYLRRLRILYRMRRDRKDGSSREGCGRVSVLKTTGLVRSYTLECNYNTGRLVNVLPTCTRDPHKPSTGFLVPPKYNPHVFEEIGQALGASILDLTGPHPWSRVPNSEFHTLNGVRDWLRVNCIPEQMYLQKAIHQGHRHVQHSRRQVVSVAGTPPRLARPTRASGAAKPNRLDTKLRLAPLPLTGKPSKATTSSSCSLGGAADGSEDTSASGLDTDRKENVTSFQIISPPKSPEHSKSNKGACAPKENLNPGSSKKLSNSKKLKQNRNIGVLKQVLAVRAKCVSVSGVASSSKARGVNPRLKLHQAASATGFTGQKSSPLQFECASSSLSNDAQMSGDCGDCSTGSVEAHMVTGEAGDCRMDQAPSKSLYADETKGIVKHGPKRLKVAALKADQHSPNSLNVASLKQKNDKAAGSKLTLREVYILNMSKEKKGVSKFTPSSEGGMRGAGCFSGEKTPWEAEQKAAGPLRTRQNPLKSKLIHRSVLAQNPISKSTKGNLPGPSTSIKLRNAIKSDKLTKSKVPHLSPAKTLCRQINAETGKKWGKATLRNFSTSMGKFRGTVKEETVGVDKKRRKSKVKR